MTYGEILNILNSRLKRAETNVDAETLAALREIGDLANWPCLHIGDEVDLIAGDMVIAYPANLRALDAIFLSDASRDYPPLNKADWLDILRSRVSNTGRSRPTRFCQRGGKFELDAECDAAYTATVYHWRHHPAGETILFPDEMAEAVYELTMSVYLEGKKMIPEAERHRQLAMKEVARFLPEADTKTLNSVYKDV